MKIRIKKAVIFGLVAIAFYGCEPSSKHPQELKKELSSIVGNDIDEYGCKGSAGYIWSDLLKECIQVFERGDTVLTKFDTDPSLAYYVILQEEKPQTAELFTPKGTFLLKKKKEIWINDVFQLERINKKWELQKLQL